MLEYEFFKSEIGTTYLNIKGKWEGLNELSSCSIDYIEEILDNLTKVLKDGIREYDFGFEIYSVECTKEVSKVIDTFDGWKEIGEIATSDVYKLMLDIRELVKNNSVISKKVETSTFNSDKVIGSFFDGEDLYPVKDGYFNWLPSDNSVWRNSFIQIYDKSIFIIQENVKVLSTFRFYEKEELEITAKKYNLKIKEENNIFYAFCEPHSKEQFQISENDEFAVIYSLQGSRAPESIFIYKIINKQTI